MVHRRAIWSAIVTLLTCCGKAAPELEEPPQALWDAPQLPPVEYRCGFREDGADPDVVLNAGAPGFQGWLGQGSFLTDAEGPGWTLWTLETQMQLAHSDDEHVVDASAERFLTHGSDGGLRVWRVRAMKDGAEQTRVEAAPVDKPAADDGSSQPAGGLGADGSLWLASPSSLDAYARDGERWLHEEGDYSHASVIVTKAGLSLGGSPEAPKVVSFDRTGHKRTIGDDSLAPFGGWLQDGQYFWTRSDEGVRVYDADAKPRTGLLQSCSDFAPLWAREDFMFCASPGRPGTRGRPGRILRYDLNAPLSAKPEVTEYDDDLMRGAMRSYAEGLLGYDRAIVLTGERPKVVQFDHRLLDKRGALRLHEGHLGQHDEVRRFGCGAEIKAWIADSGLTAVATTDGVFGLDSAARKLVWHLSDAGPGGPTLLSRDGTRMSYGGALYDVKDKPKLLATFSVADRPQTEGDVFTTRKDIVNAHLTMYAWLDHDQYGDTRGFGLGALPSLEPLPLGASLAQVEDVRLSPKGQGVVVNGWDDNDRPVMFLFENQAPSGAIEGLGGIPTWLDEARLVGLIEGELAVFDAQGEKLSTAACAASLSSANEVRPVDQTTFFVRGEDTQAVESALCVVDGTNSTPPLLKRVRGSLPRDVNQRLGVYVSTAGVVRVTPWKP